MGTTLKNYNGKGNKNTKERCLKKKRKEERKEKRRAWEGGMLRGEHVKKGWREGGGRKVMKEND